MHDIVLRVFTFNLVTLESKMCLAGHRLSIGCVWLESQLQKSGAVKVQVWGQLQWLSKIPCLKMKFLNEGRNSNSVGKHLPSMNNSPHPISHNCTKKSVLCAYRIQLDDRVCNLSYNPYYDRTLLCHFAIHTILFLFLHHCLFCVKCVFSKIPF